jgi:hypothetical protein
MAESLPVMCPSAQPGMKEPRLIGVAMFEQERPYVAYLNEPVPLSQEVLAMAGPANPNEVFRIAAHCEESRCTHFNGQQCTLATRIVQILPAVVDALPACLIRGTCRWYTQEGKAACFRCPQVITQPLDASPEYEQAARPAQQ